MNMQRPIGSGGHFEEEAGPIVTLPRNRFGGGAIAAASIGCAAILFITLNQQRLAREQPVSLRQPEAQISAPPDLALPPAAPGPSLLLAPPLTSPLVPPLVRSPAEPGTSGGPAQAQSRALTWRQLHPVVIEPWPPAQGAANPSEAVSGQPAWGPAAAAPPAPPSHSRSGPAIVQDAGESRQWGSAGSSIGAAPAVQGPQGERALAPTRASPRSIGDLSQIIAVGTMIEAVLETPVDTSRPGMTRAIVSRAVRSFDGSRVLIPRGARLVGDFGGQTEDGNRLLIKWSQLILSDGASLDIDSPGADATGQAGLDAKSHGGLGRFIGGVLQTAVTVGAVALGARGAPIYYAVPVAGSATQLMPRGSGSRRLTVAAGAQINVVVARTLDFGGSDAKS